jgi:hypothetical protein
MNRRDFVRTGVAAGISVGMGERAVATTSKEPSPMNILYLFSDQHREASLPGKPFCPVQAPHLEKFRRENFTMETCISN